MRSLLVSKSYFPPQVGGISSFMSGVARALGPDRVSCLTGARGPRDGPGPGAVRVYRRPEVFGANNWLGALSLGLTMSEIMVRDRPRVVQLASAREGNLGLHLRRALRLPFVVFAYGNEVLDAIRSEWPKPRLALCAASRVLAVSRWTADLLARAGVDRRRIELVHPGCDLDRFRPGDPGIGARREVLGRFAESRVILTVGGLMARKGHDMTIRSLPALLRRHPDVVYLIVGDGPNRGDLQQLAASSGVADRVIFAGRVPDARLPDFYRIADVFVMASRFRPEECDVEGFGMVFLEANACGKPVVAGRSGGISDAVVDGETGLLVDPTDPEAIAAAVSRILGDGQLARRLSARGVRRVREDFTWEKVGTRVQEILEAVAAEV